LELLIFYYFFVNIVLQQPIKKIDTNSFLPLTSKSVLVI